MSSTLHLSRSSLYDTFGDKRTLFLEALRLYSERVVARTAQTLQEASSPTLGIQALFDEVAAGVGSDAGAMGCFMVNSVAELVPYDSDVTAIATAYSSAFQHLLADAIVQASAMRMEPGERSAEQLAAYLFSALQGMRIMIKSGASREQIEAVSAITLQSLR